MDTQIIHSKHQVIEKPQANIIADLSQAVSTVEIQLTMRGGIV